MVLLPSQPSKPGLICPDFKLSGVDGSLYALADFKSSQALLLAIICNHCPYVRAIEDRLIALGWSFNNKELQIVGVCANDSKKYPDDSPGELFKRWQLKSYGFPYLIDADQELVRALDAQCTPEFYLFDQARRLYYHGRLDDNWQDESLVKHEDLARALESLLAGQIAPAPQHPSLGCSIKWI